MDWLLTDHPTLAWPVAGLAVAGLLVLAGVAARRRARSADGTVAAVFWGDAGTMATVLAGVVALPAAAGLVPVEGIGEPLWIVAGVAAVAAAFVLLAFRWRSQGLGALARRRVTPTAAPERRLVSTGWEIGMAVGGVAGLMTYVISAGHAFGHPIHWVIAVLGLLIGYALGIGVATPRFTLERPTGRRRG